MFSSKKSTTMFASTSSKTDSSDRDRDDPPRPPVNRTVIKLCNRVAIPLSGLINKISTEQESQVCKYLLIVGVGEMFHFDASSSSSQQTNFSCCVFFFFR